MARPPQDSRRGFCQFEKVSVDKAGWISKELIINMTHQGNNFRDSARLGRAGHGTATQGKEQFPGWGTAWHDLARRGSAGRLKTRQGQFPWHGSAGLGRARRGVATQGKTRTNSPGQAWHGAARRGMARRGNARQGQISMAWHGEARRGMAWQLKTRINFHSRAGLGQTWLGVARRGNSRQGTISQGRAGHGSARLGGATQNKD